MGSRKWEAHVKHKKQNKRYKRSECILWVQLDHSGEHDGRLLTPEWLVYGPPFARLHSVGRAQEGSDRRARVFGPANKPSPRAEWP